MTSASSSTDICNLASDYLNGETVVDIENPSSSLESLYSRWYEVSRRKLLREHTWNFAIKRAILASSATAPAFGYTKAFPLPSDCLRLVGVFDEEGNRTSTSLYEVEDGSIQIDADGTSLRISYVYDYTDVSGMDALFVDLLALEIAINTAYKISSNNTNIQRIDELIKRRSAVARAIDGQEAPPKRRQNSAGRRARQSLSSRQPHRIIF